MGQLCSAEQREQLCGTTKAAPRFLLLKNTRQNLGSQNGERSRAGVKRDGQRLHLSTGHRAALAAKTCSDFIRVSIRPQPSRTKASVIVLCGGGVVCLVLFCFSSFHFKKYPSFCSGDLGPVPQLYYFPEQNKQLLQRNFPKHPETQILLKWGKLLF